MSEQNDLVKRVKELETENAELKKEMEKMSREEFSAIMRGPTFISDSSFKNIDVSNSIDTLLHDIWDFVDRRELVYQDEFLGVLIWGPVPKEYENEGYSYWGSSKCGKITGVSVSTNGEIIINFSGNNIEFEEMTINTHEMKSVFPKELAEYVCYRLLQIENKK